MSIATRIEAIEQHITDDYSVLELAGADLTNVDKNIENLKQSWEERLLYFLANGTDVVWNNWLPKVTGTGENITLNNTIEAKMDFVYKGNTSQTGTPTPDTPIPVQVVSGDNTIKVEGKNLFDKDSVVSGFVNADGTIGGDTNAYRTSNFIPIQPNTAYYKTRTDSPRTKYYDSNKQPLNTTTYQDISIGGNEGTFTTPNNACYLRFSYPVASVDANNIMVHKGTTSTSYEPYQSQTYPVNLGNIELCKIGDYQDKIAKSTGKNLFDKDTVEEKNIDITTGAITDNNYWRLSDYISVIPSTNYMSSMINHTSNQIYVKVVYYDNTKTFISGVSSYFINNRYYGFTTPNNAKYIRFAYIVIISDIPQNIDNIMINEGTTALPYEPYGKVWYLNKQIGKVVLDGDNKRVIYANVYNNIYQFYYLATSTMTDFSQNKIYVFTNFFKGVAWSGNWTIDNSSALQSNGSLRLNTSKFDNANDFNLWLTTNNLIAYYVLATPTYEEITDTTLISQLEAIKKSYNTQTSISQVNNDLPFELDVVALGELS